MKRNVVFTILVVILIVTNCGLLYQIRTSSGMMSNSLSAHYRDMKVINNYVESVGDRGGLTVGSLFDLGAKANLKGKVTYEVCDAFTITCMSRMGCYTQCKDLDWTMGKKEDRLCRGCGSGGC